jgi:hypothetical protein
VSAPRENAEIANDSYKFAISGKKLVS